ncbi:MAG: type VI secretion system needle protein Hcp [Crocinitomicaceae bacterium]|nr:type VI secretion system needle protein Hcp [Crocinitomicaceae bacterium]
MSFNATLSIDGGEEVRLLHCSYSLNRDIDSTGRPSSMVRGGTITLEIESTEDTSLFAWMVDQYTVKKGKVLFFKRDSKTKMKQLEWEDGYLVSFTESIDSVGENPMTIHFTVSARKLVVGDAEHENPWPKA